MLETIREHSKSQDFSFRHGFVSRYAIGKNARKLRDFSDPTPVLFLLVLNSEGRHGRDSTLRPELPPNVALTGARPISGRVSGAAAGYAAV